MYMIITDLRHIRFLKPGYTRQLKHEKTILWSTVVDISVLRVNPRDAELFVFIFHSFEGGIANANSSFK